MKYCPYCKVLNDEDAKTCKICGRKLEKNDSKIRHNSKNKTKYRTKYKTRNKTIIKDKREKGKMNFFQKFLMFFLFILCTLLIGVSGFLAYHIYETEYIDIPDVTGYSYEKAQSILREKKLNVEMTEKKVNDEKNVGIVLKQSSKGKAKENQIIKLTVGVLNDEKIMPNIVNLSLEEGLLILNKNSIKYKIVYKESDNDNVILNQSIKPNKKINDNVVTITVSKTRETKDENDKTKVDNDKTKDENDETKVETE